MQVAFAYAASLATAVAPRDARCGGSAGTGGRAVSMTFACPAGMDVRSGHDDENGRPREFLTCAVSGSGMTVVPVGMGLGMRLAYACTVASAVFVTNCRTRAVAIVHDGAVRARGSSAGLAEAARSNAAFSDGAGSENSPKKGVMTRDAYLGGRQAVRCCVAANVTGS